MRSSTRDEPATESYVEPTVDPPKKSTNERLDELEAYVAFIKPRLVSLIGEEPPPPEPAPEA